ncbi:hypothetical protein BB561_005195 [Smittium simulii]|uniref:Uncharacterized protein n=1 Tax=Smittium simulii TaxID=133385 RepID=A0A2T9YBJ7_9FUNG|nr:hypothetical protein BB561_005195 [Smittium simulii]
MSSTSLKLNGFSSPSSTAVDNDSSSSNTYDLLEALAISPEQSFFSKKMSDNTLSSTPLKHLSKSGFSKSNPKHNSIYSFPNNKHYSSLTKRPNTNFFSFTKKKNFTLTRKRSKRRTRDSSLFSCASCKTVTAFLIFCKNGHGLCKNCLYIKVLSSSEHQNIPCSLFVSCDSSFQYNSAYNFCFEQRAKPAQSINLPSANESVDVYEFILSETRRLNLKTKSLFQTSAIKPASLSLYSLNDSSLQRNDSSFQRNISSNTPKNHSVNHSDSYNNNIHSSLASKHNSISSFSNKAMDRYTSDLSTLNISRLANLSNNRSVSFDITIDDLPKNTIDSPQFDQSILDNIPLINHINIMSLYPLLNSCTDEVQKKTLSTILNNLRHRSLSVESNYSNNFNSIGAFENSISNRNNYRFHKTPLIDLFNNTPSSLNSSNKKPIEAPLRSNQNRLILEKNLKQINIKLQKLSDNSKYLLAYSSPKEQMVYNTIRSNYIIRKKASRSFKNINVNTMLTFSTEEMISYEKFNRVSMISDRPKNPHSRSPQNRAKKINLLENNFFSDSNTTKYSIILKNKKSSSSENLPS